MQTRNNINAYIQKNATRCRMFWGLMYTVFFIVTWVSFYSTKICMVIRKADTLFAMSMFVATGFIVYWLLLLVILLAYLSHRALKERINSVKLVFGPTITNAMFKFLATSSFPIFSICMGDVFQDVASLWMCIALVGSLVCLLMCYGNPDDFGISYAFLGLWLGVLVHLKDPLEKSVVLIIIGVSLYVSKDDDVSQERNVKLVEVLETNASEALITSVALEGKKLTC